MARYDYRCPSCGVQFEVEHPMSERPVVTCPDCGAKAEQVFGASSIVFKGHGFYNTDQRGKGSTAATRATSSTAGSSGSGSGAGSSAGSSKDSSSSTSSSSTSASTSSATSAD